MSITTETPFHDRQDAGRRLAAAFSGEDLQSPVVLALPRGGVPVAYEVARALRAPLDVFVARKVGAPGHPEYGIGAVAEGSDHVVLSDAASHFALRDDELERMAAVEREEMRRRVDRYRRGRSLPDLDGHDVILVDDGLATGVTAEAALLALSEHPMRRLILAIPVCAAPSAERLGQLAEVVCLHRPEVFRAVGLWYEDFSQTTDDEVLDLLDRVSTRA